MNSNLIDEISKLQNALNEFITPNWKTLRSALDFQIASHQEVAELMETEYIIEGKKYKLGWKWWKENDSSKKTTDKVKWEELNKKIFDNIKIELVDLLFFSVSGISVVSKDMSSHEVELEENDWQNFVNITKYNLLEMPTDAVLIIIKLAQKLNFNIIAYYFAKHQLNYFRQLDGYKDGTYHKVVNGKEDNEHLHEMIVEISFEDIEEDFIGIYNLVAKKFYEIFSVKDEDKKFYSDWMKVIKK